MYFVETDGTRVFVSLEKYEGQSADIQLVNAYGQVLQSRHFSQVPHEAIVWQFDGLPAGAYYFSLTTSGEQQEVRGFVVRR